MTARAATIATSLFTMFVVSATLQSDVGAQPRPAPTKIVPAAAPAELVGLTQVGSLIPERGFVDDPMASDGNQLAVVVTDGADLVEATVLGPDGVSHGKIDLAATVPTVRRLYLLGTRLFVVADDPAGGPVSAVLLGLDGKVVRRQAAATDISLRQVGGKDTVVAYTRSTAASGEQHQVALFDLVSAKRIAKRGGKVTVGADGQDSKLDLRVDYWLDDHTVAVGVHGGVWRKRLVLELERTGKLPS